MQHWFFFGLFLAVDVLFFKHTFTTYHVFLFFSFCYDSRMRHFYNVMTFRLNIIPMLTT
jgi:hypothetical protein